MIHWVEIQTLDEIIDRHPETDSDQKRQEVIDELKQDYNKRANGPMDPHHYFEDPLKFYKPWQDTVLYYQGNESESSSIVLKSAGNGFYQTFASAWAQHRGVIISPDDIFTALCLQFNLYVSKNAETLRYLFVKHQDKKELTVHMIQMDWLLYLDKVQELIQENLQSVVADDFLPQFSSSTPLDQSLKSLSLMDTMKAYFDYRMSCICGITKIGFLGSLEDWLLLKSKIISWKKYHIMLPTKSNYFPSLNDWIDQVLDILDHFISAYKKEHIDLEFWNDVLQKRRTHGSGASEYIQGWLNVFLTNNYMEELDVKDIPSQRFNVSVHVNNNNSLLETHILGGFTGILYDTTNLAYQPQKSICVIKEDKPRIETEEEMINRLKEELGPMTEKELEILIKRVKEAQKSISIL